jgi:NDP-4-keto-2,6-dideoxyhexose 3-C-methyltransferase
MSKAIERCRVCGNAELEPVIDLGMQALTGVFPRSIDQKVPVEPLDLVRCAGSPGACGLVQLRHSCDPAQMYGENYGYRSGLNPSMIQHLANVAQDAKRRVQLSPGDLALDIGSNDGTLLRALGAPGITLTGMDPTADKFREFYPPNVNVIPEVFSSASFRKNHGGRKAKIVTSIAMFYDLESPMRFMEEVAGILADDGVWVFEQSYLPSMLESTSYDTICHEHLEYYALTQIDFMAQRAGLAILDVSLNDANGGSFRVTAGHARHRPMSDTNTAETLLNDERVKGYDRTEVFEGFRSRVAQRKEELTSALRNIKRDGRHILGYGASTKGNVILQYCGITTEDLPAICEVNPDKFGCFTPKSLIPIIPEPQAGTPEPDVFLVLPWHFRKFVIDKEQRFLKRGGQLLFPLPTVNSVTAPIMVAV